MYVHEASSNNVAETSLGCMLYHRAFQFSLAADSHEQKGGQFALNSSDPEVGIPAHLLRTSLVAIRLKDCSMAYRLPVNVRCER